VAIGTLWAIDLALAGVSVAFLIGLVYVYANNYRQLRSPFSLGLVLFASLFIIENLAAMVFYINMSDANVGANVALPMLALSAAELVGFAALFYVTWR
jgi:hypothetical protein